MSKRHTYRDHNGSHWIAEDDLDAMIIQNAQVNVADLGIDPNEIGWNEYGKRLDEMIRTIIESRVADGLEIK